MGPKSILWDLKLFYGTLRYSSSILNFIYEPLTNNWDKASHSKGLLPCGSITLARTFLHKLLVGFGWDWEGKTSRGFLRINVKNIRATCNAFYVQNLNTLINCSTCLVGWLAQWLLKSCSRKLKDFR